MNTSDNCGTGCTTGSACAFLWEDDATQNREYATKYRIFFACLLVIDKGGPIMKKVFCLVVLLSMALTMFFPVNASHVDEHFVPEKYSYDELLAMDETLDSDCDGLSDVLELFYQFNRYSQDTDNDGVSDDLEFYVTGTDVLVPDGEIDSDGDGLTNAQECT
jgi:hypothetical protein